MLSLRRDQSDMEFQPFIHMSWSKRKAWPNAVREEQTAQGRLDDLAHSSPLKILDRRADGGGNQPFRIREPDVT